MWILVLFSCFKSIQVSSMLRQWEGSWTTFTSDASDVTAGVCPGGQGGSVSMLSVQLHTVPANIEISWNSRDLEWKQKCWKRPCLQHISKSWWIRSGFRVLLSLLRQWQSFPWVPCASPAIFPSQAGVSIKAPIASSAENSNAKRDPWQSGLKPLDLDNLRPVELGVSQYSFIWFDIISWAEIQMAKELFGHMC